MWEKVDIFLDHTWRRQEGGTLMTITNVGNYWSVFRNGYIQANFKSEQEAFDYVNEQMNIYK